MESPRTQRHIAFCDRVVAGEPYGAAWAASALDVNKEPGSKKASTVSGSRMAARYAEYTAQSKHQNAAKAALPDSINSTSLNSLMDTVSESLRLAVTACEERGEITLSQRMRTTLTQHCSRVGRVERRIGGEDKKTGQDLDTDAMLSRMACTCE